MDIPSKNMYDTFKDEIWKELGPLDPDWFEALTAQTLNNDDNVSDQDDLCANQEGVFKAPFDKTAVDSQLFSTPKVFRQRRIVSPEPEMEQSFTAEHETQKLPWTETQSPCLFQMSKEGFPGPKYGSIPGRSLDSFDLLRTPQQSPTSYAKQISESLGAQIHPDMSWTSSLNTPTGAPSTLILTKPEESPVPESIPEEKNVVLVRKLFPSLSNTSRVEEVSLETADRSAVHQDVCLHEAAQNPEFPKDQLNQIDGVWSQKPSDAPEDEKIHSAVSNTLDDTEKALCTFFPNSSSNLRKVKTDRVKRKQIIPTEEQSCSSTETTTTNSSASKEQDTAERGLEGSYSSPQVKSSDQGTSQWSPLSLSEISSCTTSCCDPSTATQVKNSIFVEHKDSDSGTQVRTALNATDSGFTKKKRTFIYNVRTPRQPEKESESKQSEQGKETLPERMKTSLNMAHSEQDLNKTELAQSPDKASFSMDINMMPKQEYLFEKEENPPPPPPLQAEFHDLDMSQLCRDFAQDFSDTSDPGQLSRAEEEIPETVFSPSACLSAMKQAKQKSWPTNLHQDCDIISKRENTPATKQNYPISEVTITDSGFQSAVPDLTHMTASSFVVPSSENTIQSQQWSDFNTKMKRNATSQSENNENVKICSEKSSQEAVNDSNLSSTKKGETQCPGKESELQIESTPTLPPSRAKGAVNSIECTPLNGQTHVSLLKGTSHSHPSGHTSGFKTASNKGIQISAANLQKAKRLFEETEEERTTHCVHGSKDRNPLKHESVRKAASNLNKPPASNEKSADVSCELTASQKADVTELCTLLEEADSQFEFTPLQTVKLKQHIEDNSSSSQRADKTLDADFLAEIDFDDSFNLGPTKHQAASVMQDKMAPALNVKRNCETSNSTVKSTGLSLSRQMTEEEHPAEDVSSSTKLTSEGSGSDMSTKLQTLDGTVHTETNISESNNPPVLGMGFKTAGGNILRVSKKCLGKARALFADLEENLVSHSQADAKALQRLREDKHPVNVLNHKEDIVKPTSCGNEPSVRIQDCVSNEAGEQVSGIIDEDSAGFNYNKMDTRGFQMASGKRISVSAKAMQEADTFFKDCEVIDRNSGASAKPRQRSEPLSRSVKNLNQKDLQVTATGDDATKSLEEGKMDSSLCGGEFQMASGKKVSVSAKAMQEADAFFKDCDLVECNVEPSAKLREKNEPLSNSAKSLGHRDLHETVNSDATKTLESTKLDTNLSREGFQMASGRRISVSAEAMQGASAFFKDCDTINSNTDVSVRPREIQEPLARGVQSLGFKDSLINGISHEDTTKCHKNTILDNNSCQGGFQLASGGGVSVSAKAMQEADAFFKDCDTIDRKTGKFTKPRRKDEPLAQSVKKFVNSDSHVAHCNDGAMVKSHKNIKTDTNLCRGGFQMASGKGVSISAKAMQEADAFFKDCVITDCNADTSAKPRQKTEPLSSHVKRLGSKDSPALKNTAALHGNLSSSTKTLSCTTPKDIVSSDTDKLSNGGGFCTARGEKMLVSAEAIRNAERLFAEDHRPEEMYKPISENVGNLISPEGTACNNGGFQMANGKGVSISSAALKKARLLLSDSDDVEDKSVKPSHLKMQVPGTAAKHSRDHAAGGKQVAFSAEALQKAKTLFSDISFKEENPSGSDTRNHNKEQNNTETVHMGFSTAGGARVHVSKKKLLEAKNIFKEFEDDPAAEVMQMGDDCDIVDNTEAQHKSKTHQSKSRNDKNHKDDQNVAKKSEQIESGCTEFKNINARAAMNHEKMTPLNAVETHKGLHKNMLDSANGSSFNGNPALMIKPLSSPLCSTSNSTGCSLFNELSNSGAFCTAGGKKVSVSEAALTRAKFLLNDTACEEMNHQMNQKEVSLPPHNGFQAPSGKRDAVSSAALKDDKTLPSECGKSEDETSVKPNDFKMANPGQPPRSRRFQPANGRPEAFSSEALQKAKAVFSDIGFGAEIPAGSDSKSSDKKQNSESIKTVHCGFMTAGGAKVQVSEKNLLKAKTLFKEIDEGESHDLKSKSPGTYDTQKSDLPKDVDVQRTSGSNRSSASYKEKPVEGRDPEVVMTVTNHKNDACQNSNATDLKLKERNLSPSMVDSLNDSLGEEMSNMLDQEVNQTSISERSNSRTDESSVLLLQSLNLTETQQKLLAQEALDCTKALLEDESFTATQENVEFQENSKSSSRDEEGCKGKGKRPVEDLDMTGQPPLKRRLLGEFDRTVDGPKVSLLSPELSCPNGLMKDRSVFKYRDSLHPNITRPQRGKNQYIESRLQKTTPTQHATPGGSRSTFVPPFLKNVKTESCKNAAPKDNIRAPPVFVPPFKKQRTIVQESSSKPQQEADKRCSVSAVPTNSNTVVPPTKKTQSNTERTGDESAEDNNLVALEETTNDKHMNYQKLPVGCESEKSVAETSERLSGSQEMLQNLQNTELARDMQDMRIRKKKRQTIRPMPGSLFLTKTSGVSRIKLRAAVSGKSPGRYTPKQLYESGVHQHVCGITGEAAESFRFRLQQFIKQDAFIDGGGVQLADGGWLIPSNDGTTGKQEFYRALCDTPGVDPKLISEEWVYNHYRWIVWKQASMERSFPETMGSLSLTPEQVLLQLKYRYDVEVDHSRRPALRKIMEKDDTAAKTLVLCVCGVVSEGHPSKRQSFSDTKALQGGDTKLENLCAVVWLTDGWYSVKAQLDEPLTAMLHKGRLSVGGKMIIYGAQLVGSQDACSPLEAPESLMLKICANSSRPARWDAKLGFHRDPRPFLLPVSSLYSNGGPVGCVDIVILRSYPIQWMERKPDGGVVFRSDRAEEKEARRYDSNKQKSMEILCAKIQAEFEKEEKGKSKPKRRRRTISRQDVSALQDGEELYEAVEEDPAYLEAHLSDQQLETLRAYRRSLMERKQAELQDRYRRALESAENSEGSCPKRDVTPVWRLCFADSVGKIGSIYQLNLWRPTSDYQTLLKEGCRYKVYNLTTSDGKKLGGSTSVQLTGTKKTQFQDLQSSPEWLSTRFQPRVSTNFVDLQHPEYQPLCGEVDLTGFVISVVDGQGSSPAFYQADGELNFVKVRCFNSLAQSGLEDVVKSGVFLALSNLQLRGQSAHPTPVVYAGDLTVFSTNPKEPHLRESLSQLRNLVQSQENFFHVAEEKLSQLLKSDSFSSPALQLQTPTSSADRRQSTRTSVAAQHQVRSLGTFTPVGRDPPSTNSSSEKDPVSLKRKRALDYLSRIPSPPPLALLGSVSSPCVKKTFNPPRRSGTPSTLKTVKTVQTAARKHSRPPVEEGWVNDEELAMIDTQALLPGE